VINFQYVRAANEKAAVQALAKDPKARLIAGGTNLLDLMKKGVMNPEKLIDINKLPLKRIDNDPKKIRIGALALNADVAEDVDITRKYPLLGMALQAGASAQLRNMATVGGNMMQRTRCPYFYNTDLPCNKRQPGSGCGALKGYNRMHAIFGASDLCIAVHPSDMCIALAALDAVVVAQGAKGERRIPFLDFHRLPGDKPQLDNNLQPGELITWVEIPENNFAQHYHYLKIRDRASYAFALISVAAALHLDGNTIRDARLAMGGVAHKPWRLKEAEAFLKGKSATEKTFADAAQIAMKGAKGYGDNNFKLKLAPAAIAEALKLARDKS
jgi:xanthine dehydrogenase YagS FAD-binding subunit